VKTVLMNAAQRPHHACLTPMAVLEELAALCREPAAHEFLQQEVVDGYHDHEGFVRVVEAELLDLLDAEIRDAMGIVSETQYRELFDRYLALVSAWTRGERLQNRITGAYERPDEARMVELERVVMPEGEDRTGFRRALISTIGAYRLDHPGEGAIDTPSVFPDLFRRLREHSYAERKRQIERSKADVLRYLSDDRAGLDEKARREVEGTLATLRDRHGYCPHCAQEAVLFLMRRRYVD
jgi:predicted Ser/Thr protein kinase